MRKLILAGILFIMLPVFSPAQETVNFVDVKRFQGEWFVNAAIPTALDKKWICTVDNYTWNAKGYYDVLTTYKKKPGGKQKRLKQKLVPVAGSGNARYVAKLWIFRASYLVLDLANDYSYALVGSSDKSYLYILSRNPQMEDKLYNKLVESSKAKGYDIGKIKKQVQESP